MQTFIHFYLVFNVVLLKLHCDVNKRRKHSLMPTLNYETIYLSTELYTIYKAYSSIKMLIVDYYIVYNNLYITPTLGVLVTKFFSFYTYCYYFFTHNYLHTQFTL